MSTNARKSLYQFAYARSPDQDAPSPVRRPVVVIGAGPVGLALALDLGQRGVPVVVLDDADRIGEGSRGICYAKRTLEILNRLGIGAKCLEKGVTWKVGRVFQGEEALYSFDLLPEGGHQMPAFVNLQQYYLEHYLVTAALTNANVEIRWRNKVIAIAPRNDGARLTIETPDGAYDLDADWVCACDGARSPTRAMLGLDFMGEVFEERFLIADVKMTGAFPTERWFWFDPPFHPGRSALLHKQPDDVWRIDLGLGAEADAAAEQRPERVIPRIEAMLGHSDFALEWVSVYTFQCRRLERFLHGRVIFAGDSAHQVSPFGARGANSGIQDAENLAWKLARVVRGEAPPALLDTYERERIAAADENIGHSTRSTDFIAPRSPQETRLRDAALALARTTEFGKRLVNSGRLSTPSVYADTPLTTPDRDDWGGSARLGGPMPDAPLVDRDGRAIWLLEALGGAPTAILARAGADLVETPPGVARLVIGEDVRDEAGLLAQRLDLTPGSACLVRPDQHLAARFRRPSAADLAAAASRMLGGTP